MRYFFRITPWVILFVVLISESFFSPIAFSEPMEAKGPLQTINRFPPHLIFLTPTPQSPRLVPKAGFNGSMAFDYTSMFMLEESDAWDVLMDMEMTTIEFAGEYGLTHNFSFGFEVPLVSMNDGFLDNPLETFHDFFGLPNYGKDARPKNKFAYHMEKDEEQWFKSERGGLHLADSKISLKAKLMDQNDGDPLTASLLYSMKVPVGDEVHGFGSGQYDHGFFLLSQIPIDPFILYLSPGYIIISDPETEGADIAGQDVVSLFAGAEYLLNDKWSLLAQINYYTSPIEKTGIKKIDNHSAELSFGFIYDLGRNVDLEFSFSEDLNRGAPDFSVHGRIIVKSF